MTEVVKYALITPVRDEEEHIAATIAAVVGQTITPREWIIVNDGSSDNTAAIIQELAAKVPWIRMIDRPNRGFRKSGGGVVEAFYDGYQALQSSDWEFVVKLDGDLTFRADYFENCFAHFREDPTLGIGGGDIYHDLDGELTYETNPRFHVRGATKIYRRACWEAIGGLRAAPGWDTIDEVKANMLGWKTYSFSELHLLHHRLTGAAEGALRDRIKHGVACYQCGYHPLFVSASCIIRLSQRPYLIGSAAIFFGFLKGYLTGARRANEGDVISYMRGQQLRRLLGRETIWK